MAIDWSRGYSCSWHAYEVRRDTWADGTPLNAVETARIERSCAGDSELLESGDITLTAPVGLGWYERYVRLVMVAEQAGEKERVEVCTLLCTNISGEVNRGVDVLRVTGRSVLWPASVARITLGSYAPEGVDGADLAARLLREVIAAPVEVDGSFELDSSFVYDTGATVLSVVWELLSAGNYALRIAGNGTVSIAPYPTAPALNLNHTHARLLHPGMPHELDWSEVPNRYVAIEGFDVAEAVNDEPNSATSITTRGYRYDVVDTSPVRLGGETLEAYAARKLEEASVAHDVREWTREWWPNVLPGDIVRASISSVDAEGDFRIRKQSLTCGRGITVEEQALKEVYSWQRT